jgi:hypothetical protein
VATAGRPDATGLLNTRTMVFAGGFALAVAATLAVFLTDNRQYLQLAVIAMAWAFVLAAFTAGRRGADRATAAAREIQLRQGYQLELEREVAARREYELDLEHDLRREAEDAMRDQLDALRAELSSLAPLREEVARLADLRHELTGLAALRDDVARVAALREDITALASLRADLGQLGELRADMGRLRADLTEQLSSEMLVERIVMRTQGRWSPADRGRSDAPSRPLDVTGQWVDDAPPRELTGGWPAVRLDDPRHAETVRGDRPVPGHPAPAAPLWPTGPGTSTFARVAPAPPPAVTRTPSPEPPESPETHGSHRSRHSADEPAEAYRPAPPAATTESPLEWLAARSLRDAMPPPMPPPMPPSMPPPVPPAQVPLVPSTALRPSPRPRPRPTPSATTGRPIPEFPPVRRRTDDVDAGSTAERSSVTAEPPPAGDIGSAPGTNAEPRQGNDGNDGNRLGEILAENGVSVSTGGRRRRRYREDGESDDVLARVLGLN